jgi:hypothetical protein
VEAEGQAMEDVERAKDKKDEEKRSYRSRALLEPGSRVVQDGKALG